MCRPFSMTLLTSFPPESRVAIIGASGSIGAAVLRLLSQDERVAEIHAFSRNGNIAALPKVIAGHIDLEDEASIAGAAAVASRDGPLDLVFVASGILWEGDDLRPEKAMREDQHGTSYAALCCQCGRADPGCKALPAEAPQGLKDAVSQRFRPASAASATIVWVAGIRIVHPKRR